MSAGLQRWGERAWGGLLVGLITLFIVNVAQIGRASCRERV